MRSEFSSAMICFEFQCGSPLSKLHSCCRRTGRVFIACIKNLIDPRYIESGMGGVGTPGTAGPQSNTDHVQSGKYFLNMFAL